MSAATIKIVYRKDKKNDKNEAPIHIRITKHRKPHYIATGYKMHIKYWDFENNKVRKSYPNSNRLNNYLNKLKVEYTDRILEDETNNFAISSKRLKEKVLGSTEIYFFNVADEIINGYKEKGSVGVYSKTQSIINKLKEFTKNDKLTFEDIDVRFLTQYESHLREVQKNVTNTIAKDFKFIRRVFSYAYKQELITNSLNPFKNYIINTEKTFRDSLSEQEIELFEKFNNANSATENLYRDIFLFQYWSGGLRISDVLLLKWSNIHNGILSIVVKKTNQQVSNKLTPQALAIINRYTKSKSDSDGFIFGLLPDNLNLSNNIEIDKYISRGTALINKGLKSIQKKLKINKNISTHIARHSFAMNALKRGITLEEVQKILFHVNIRETQIYAKILNPQAYNAMDKFGETNNINLP